MIPANDNPQCSQPQVPGRASYVLRRADALLEARAEVHPGPKMALMASTAFALSALALSFIMVMGVGYESLAEPQASTGPLDARLVPYGRIEEAQAVPATPLRDEDGRVVKR